MGSFEAGALTFLGQNKANDLGSSLGTVGLGAIPWFLMAYYVGSLPQRGF